MKRITMLLGSLMLVMSPPLAGAVQMQQCSTLSSDLGTARNNVSNAENSVQLLVSDLNSLAGDVEVPLDIQTDIQKASNAADTINDLLSDLALLAEFNPEIAEPLNSVSTAVSNITQNVIDPMNNTITNIVDTLHLQQLHDALQDSANGLQNNVVQPLDTTHSDLQNAVNVTNDSTNVVNRMPSGACQNKVAQAMDTACGAVDTPVNAVDQATSTTIGAVQGVVNNVSTVIQDFSVFNQVRNDLRNLNQSLNAITGSLRSIKSLLNTKIVLVKSMFGTVEFSIQQILNDWNTVVNDVKKYLGLQDAEKWLRKMIGNVMKTEVKALKREVNGMLKSVGLTFDLSSVSNLLNKIHNDVANLKAQVNSDISTMTTNMKNAANQDCK